MSKRGRSMSFDRPRALSSLEDELNHISGAVARDIRGVGENLIFKILQQRDFSSIWMNLDLTTRAILDENRLKGVCSRRQVVADTIRCCVIEDISPQASGEDTLFEFSGDLDHRSVGILQKNWKTDRGSLLLVPSRACDTESPVTTRQDIDLTLGAYEDAFSMEELYSYIPYSRETGAFDLSNVGSICKTIPWFDEFTETISCLEFPMVGKLHKLCRVNFVRLKILYSQLGQKCASIHAKYWNHRATEKLRILNYNFPRGIVGYRALTIPGDPRHIRAILVKQTDKVHSQMMTHNKKAEDKEKDKLEEVEDLNSKESKHASIPDLKQVWQSRSVFPRVQYLSRNKLVTNMVQAEHECIDQMAPWSIPEIRIYLERIAVHAKNFKRVAVAIPDKSERDCIELYYRFKVHLSMKQIVAAGIQARQERNNNSYKGLIDCVLEDLEKSIGPNGVLFSHAQLGEMNLQKFKIATLEKKPTADIGDESPRRERRNAIMDILVNVLGKGYPVPPQLGSLVESTMTSPAITPSLAFYMPSANVTPRPTLSMVKTEVTVLGNSRELLPHHTI